MTKPFDYYETKYASVKGGASKKKVVTKSSTKKPKVVKKVKKSTKSTKKMKGGEETQGATGMPPQYFNALPPAKVSSKTNVQPFDPVYVQNLATYKANGGKKTTKKPLKKLVKKSSKLTKKMKGGEETQGATGMPPQYFNALPPAKVSSKTNVQPFDPVYVQNLATYKANGGKKTTKKPLKKPVKKSTISKSKTKKSVDKEFKSPCTTKKITKKGGNSPIELPKLLDFAPQEEGLGIMSDLMKFAKSATGGKKPTKKSITKKCLKGCKCVDCTKKKY